MALLTIRPVLSVQWANLKSGRFHHLSNTWHLYFRVPLMIEDPSFASYIDVAYNGPVSLSVADPVAFIWSVIKWAISCEIYFQEFFLTDRGNLSGTKRLMDAWLIITESIYRPKIIEKLNSFEFAEGDDLKSVYTAVIKTFASDSTFKGSSRSIRPFNWDKPPLPEHVQLSLRQLTAHKQFPQFSNSFHESSKRWAWHVDGIFGYLQSKIDQDKADRISPIVRSRFITKHFLMRRVLAEKKKIK